MVSTQWQSLPNVVHFHVNYLRFVESRIILIHFLARRFIDLVYFFHQSFIQNDERLRPSLVVMFQSRLSQHVLVQCYTTRSLFRNKLVWNRYFLLFNLLFDFFQCFGLEDLWLNVHIVAKHPHVLLKLARFGVDNLSVEALDFVLCDTLSPGSCLLESLHF